MNKVKPVKKDAKNEVYHALKSSVALQTIIMNLLKERNQNVAKLYVGGYTKVDRMQLSLKQIKLFEKYYKQTSILRFNTG